MPTGLPRQHIGPFVHMWRLSDRQWLRTQRQRLFLLWRQCPRSWLDPCDSFCVDTEQPISANDIDLRCANHCDITYESDCTDEKETECLQGCAANTSGLPFDCAACLIDNGSKLNDSGFSCSGGSVRDLGFDPCDDFCE